MLSRTVAPFSAGLLFVAVVCHVAFGSGTDDARATTQAITVKDNGSSLPDFDGDGTVGFGDFVKFAAKFGLSQGDVGYDAQFDLNGDAEIGFADFLIFAENFGKELPADDRAVLVAFYNVTDGANWTNKERWLSAAPLDEWHGVTTRRRWARERAKPAGKQPEGATTQGSGTTHQSLVVKPWLESVDRADPPPNLGNSPSSGNCTYPVQG